MRAGTKFRGSRDRSSPFASVADVVILLLAPEVVGSIIIVVFDASSATAHQNVFLSIASFGNVVVIGFGIVALFLIRGRVRGCRRSWRERSDTARALFADAFDSTPIGTWSAPGRVNLIGEHTDYNDGFVLPFAIQHRMAVSLGLRDDDRIRVMSSLTDDTVEVALGALDILIPAQRDEVPEWARYPLGVAWALGAEGRCGVDLAFASNVPIGAGVSSSAAIESATAAALNDVWQLGLDRSTLARAGRQAENDAVGAPTGIMDQMASMTGRTDAAIFLDCRSLTAELVDLGFADAGLELVVIDTGVAHAHASGGY